MPNLKLSFSQAHNCIEGGEWARKINRYQLPVSKSSADLNMYLTSEVMHAMHWNEEAEEYVSRQFLPADIEPVRSQLPLNLSPAPTPSTAMSISGRRTLAAGALHCTQAQVAA